MSLTLHERAASFASAFPDVAKYGGGLHVSPSAQGFDKFFATWTGGADYRNKSKLYGAYPPYFLPRVFSIFPDARRVLHLFSGSLTAEHVEGAWKQVNVRGDTQSVVFVPPPGPTTRWIPLQDGRVALVDEEDYVRLYHFKWHFHERNGVRRTENDAKIMLHREVLDAPDGVDVDHINGDRLDNRRCNLRLANAAQNQANKRRSSNNTSGYKGVAFNSLRQKWMAYITVDGRRIYLGCDYDSAKAAARAYDEAACKRFGAFARVNFPTAPTQIRLDSGLHPAAKAAKPDVVGDAENLLDRLEFAQADGKFSGRVSAFDLVIADPPYGQEDQEKYTGKGSKLVNKKKVIAECAKVVRPGGFLAWLDTSWPMHNKQVFRSVGHVTILRSTNHRVRTLTVFERV